MVGNIARAGMLGLHPLRATRATTGTYPSCLALIRLGNVAAQLALRAQPRRKEQRCCVASASHSGKTKGARPTSPHRPIDSNKIKKAHQLPSFLRLGPAPWRPFAL